MMSLTVTNPGTITSPPINFSSFLGATLWDEVTWDGSGTIEVGVYADAEGNSELITPTTSTTIDLEGINHETNPTIYLKATLADEAELNYWKVSAVNAPDEVEATKLVFNVEPSANVCPNTNMATAAVIRAVDEDNFLDTSFEGEITITNAGDIGMSNNTVTAVEGVATFTNLQFAVAGNAGLLTASSDELTSAESTTSVTVLGVPENPSFTTSDISNNSITWNWEEIDNVDRYDISFDGGAWTNNGTSNSYTASSLSPNQQYSLEIKAVRCGLDSDETATSNIFTYANVPNAPTVEDLSPSRISIEINENSNPAATEFAIYFVNESQYIDANGNITGTEVWQTKADWGTVEVTGLQQNTAYSFRVKARNANNIETAFSPLGSATTPCGVESFPFFEGFEDYDGLGTSIADLNPCYVGGGTENWVLTDVSNSGSRGMRFSYTSKPWLFIPVYLEAGAIYSFSAYASTPGGGWGNAYITVEYGQTATIAGMTSGTIISETVIPSEDGYTQIQNTFIAPSTGLFYIGISGEGDGVGESRYLDDILIEKLACPIPTSLTYSDVTQTTATISWTAASPAPDNGYQYYISTLDDAPGELTAPSATVGAGVTEANLTELTANTRYYFWVRSDCDNGDLSNWVGPQTFRTECGPAGIPFFEGFEDGFVNNDPIEGCYFQEHEGGNTYQWNAFNSNEHQGSWSAGLYQGSQRWLFMPVSLEEGVSYNVSVFARGEGSITLKYGEGYGSVNMNTFIVNNQALSGSYTEYSAIITPAATGDYYIGILGNNTSVIAYLSIDNVTVRKIPTATISGTVNVCENAGEPNITFTNPQALPVTITYKINGGDDLTLSVAANSSANVAAPTGTDGVFEYTLESVRYQTEPHCENSISGSATVTVDPQTVAGTVTGGTNVCTGTNSTVLNLVGYTGAIIEWQSSTDNWSNFSVIEHTTNQYTAENLSQTTEFRAIVQSGVCDALNSGFAEIVVDPINVGGTASSDQTILSGTQPNNISVSGNVGDVIEWQKDDNIGFESHESIDVQNTTLTGNEIGNLTETTYFRAVVQSGECSPAFSTIVTITVVDGLLWTGSVSSDWSTVGNWIPSIVPDDTYDVIIPASYTNAPIINNDKSAPALCKNLNIEANAVLSIAENKALTVTENLTNNGVLNLASNFADGDGSLIVQGNILGSGTYNVERSLKASQWHQVSSPITNATAGVFMDLYLLEHDESIFDWVHNITDPETSLPVGQGFLLWADEATTRTFSGTVNHGIVSKSLQRTTTLPEEDEQGWNFIGNPYPSAIDWNASSGWTKNNVENAVYIWNNDNYASYVEGTGTNEGSQYIAMGQGFFVRAEVNGASISMNNDVRVHNAVPFRNNEEIPNLIRIRVEGNNSSDESVIYYQSLTNDSYDGRYDAAKLWGSEHAPQLYTKKGESNMSINSQNNLDNVDGMFVYLQVGAETEYTISFSHTLVEYNNLVMRDLVTGIFIQPNDEYSFLANPDDNPVRFQFTYDVTDISAVLKTNIHTWVYNNILYVKIPDSQHLNNIVIYNMLGSVVMNSRSVETDLSNLPTGVYMVKVKTDSQTEINKIVVK